MKSECQGQRRCAAHLAPPLPALVLLLLAAAAAGSRAAAPDPAELPPRPVVYLTTPVGLEQTMPASAPALPAQGPGRLAPKVSSKIDCGLRDFLASVRGQIALHGAALDGRSLSTYRFLLSRTYAVQVYVECSRWNEATRAALERLGMAIEIVAPAPRATVQGWLPQAAVEEAASLDFVQWIRAPGYPVVSMGSKQAESDAILKTYVVRGAYGVDGTGTRVGVLSDSADVRASAQATGDLPPDSSIYIGKAGTGANEGTAMLEIVYDEAPGALLGFYGPASSLDMAAGITDLQSHGCGIIVDDLSYLDQPCFQEGPIEQAINNVTAAGSVYLTCAANFAQQHHAATYNGVTANVLGAQGVNVHSFGSITAGLPEYLMPVNCPANTNTIIVLQWDSPWGSAADDYDLYLCDQNATGYYAKSDNAQDGAGNPIEVLSYNPGAAAAWRFVLVSRYSGAARKMKIYTPRSILDTNYRVVAGSIGFNNKAQNALVVGAISAINGGEGNIEAFSNQGPVAISWPAAAVWNKPDITGIDGVQVTGAGGFPVPFYGTSAASPSIAGVAALCRSAKPTATVAEVKAAITQHTVDRGTTGYDTVYGWGLSDAVGAMQAVRPYHLIYYTYPLSATAGASFSTQPLVAVLNTSGSVVTSYTGPITMSIKPGTGTAGAVLGGTRTVNAVAGVATFTGLSIDLVGNGYVLAASSEDAGTADTPAFNVSAVPTPAKLAFFTQPGGANANAPLSPQPVVVAQDANGLTFVAFNGPITLAIKAGTGTSGAALKGTVTVNATSGIASFSGLSIDRGGTGYVLTATAGALSVDSAPVTIAGTNPPGDLDKNGVFSLADLVLGLRVLGGLGVFP